MNELDLKLQEIREAELQSIVEEASKLREQATDVHEAMEEVNNYLNRLQDLCAEVISIQNEMSPDRIKMTLLSFYLFFHLSLNFLSRTNHLMH